MSLSLPRVLSLALVGLAYAAAWTLKSGAAVVTVIALPGLAMIWFPAQIDDYTFGTWHRGFQIDSHTPAGLIAAMGWILLLILVSALWYGRLSGKLTR